MIKYQVFENDRMILDNATITEAYSKIPAGSKLISGNTSKSLRKDDGSEQIVEEIKAVYQVPCKGLKITVIQI